MHIFLLIIFIIAVVLAFASIKVVKQSEVYIIERLGKFHKAADAGLTIIIPWVICQQRRAITSLSVALKTLAGAPPHLRQLQHLRSPISQTIARLMADVHILLILPM